MRRRSLSFLIIGIASAAVLVAIGLSLAGSNASTGENNENIKNGESSTRNEKLTVSVTESATMQSALAVNVTHNFMMDKPSSELKLWKISLDGDSQNTNTGFISITDENQRSVINGPIFQHASMIKANAICGPDVTRTAVLSSPAFVPLVEGTQGNISTRYALGDVKPDSDGNYRLVFTSLYEAELKLPGNSVITADKSQTCSIDYEGFDKVFFYEVTFNLEKK